MFTILSYLEQLTPAKGKNRFVCPVCGGDNLTVDPKSGKYQCWSGCDCREIRDAVAPLPEKQAERKIERKYEYFDDANNPLIQVVRKDDGKGSKQIYQNYWHRAGWQSASKVPEEVKQQAKRAVLPYRYLEATKHDRIFWVEGEKCADALWAIGILAVTSIGGCEGLNRYGDYSGLFDGKELVICPDQDSPGIKYADGIAALYPAAKWLYALPSDPRWEKPPAKGGLDIADWIAQGATKEQILEAVEQRRVKVQPRQEKAASEDGPESKLARSIKKFGTLLGDRIQFNEVSGRYEFDGKPTTIEDFEITLALDFDIDIPRNFQAVVKAIAKPYHPVREYLEACHQKHGDQATEILDTLAERHFGCSNPIYNLFVRKWAIGAARRVFEPGTKFDTVLVLHGPQGYGKSSWFRVLSNGSFDDSIGAINDKDERLKLHRSWFNEWAELEGTFKRKDIAAIKSFVTTQTDRLRPPYGREVIDLPRWSIIVASTNQEEFLADSTGNRRFPTIPVGHRINLELVEQERDRIWAAAVALYRQGEAHWLDAEGDAAAAEAIKQYEFSDPWESLILDYLEVSGRSDTSVEELLLDVLKLDLKDADRQKQMRVADILKRANWTRSEGRTVRNGKRVRLWLKPRSESKSEPKIQASVNLPQQPVEQSEATAEVNCADSNKQVQAVATVISTAQHFKPGVKVKYQGSRYSVLNSGKILTLHSKDPGSGYWCAIQPDGRLSTWIPAADLTLVGGG